MTEQPQRDLDRHRLMKVLADRTETGSLPGARTDGYRVVPAIEGGGMRGTVSMGSRLVAAVAFRQYTPQFRAAFLNRPARLADDDLLLAAYDTDAAVAPTDPAVLSVRPDAAAPSLSRLETDSALLEEALETGRRAIMAQFAPAARS
ncbi:hypothetical protein ACFXDF_46450 [Streptomyces sp. NPDC059426]|uniref:hypothetical protein n=1 Tax=Streptomyces sp. NPDC059426 TaxID=3346827 RepID=UPI003690CA6B